MFNFGGGMLTGTEIAKQVMKGNIEITGFDSTQLNPNSYNLRLHPELKIYTRGDEDERKLLLPGAQYDDKHILQYPTVSDLELAPIDMKKLNQTTTFMIPEKGYTLQPGVVYIGRTWESTKSDKFIPMINGRSSGGRLGISIHVCAGFGDIGFDGTWTLEITCVEPVTIYPNVEIAQVCYFKPYGKSAKLYKGRYQNQRAATPSRFYLPKK